MNEGGPNARAVFHPRSRPPARNALLAGTNTYMCLLDHQRYLSPLTVSSTRSITAACVMYVPRQNQLQQTTPNRCLIDEEQNTRGCKFHLRLILESDITGSARHPGRRITDIFGTCSRRPTVDPRNTGYLSRTQAPTTRESSRRVLDTAHALKRIRPIG